MITEIRVVKRLHVQVWEPSRRAVYSATEWLIRRHLWVEEGTCLHQPPAKKVVETTFLRGVESPGRVTEIVWGSWQNQVLAQFPGGSLDSAWSVIRALRQDGFERAYVTVLQNSDPTILRAAGIYPDGAEELRGQDADRYPVYWPSTGECAIEGEVSLELLEAALDKLNLDEQEEEEEDDYQDSDRDATTALGHHGAH